MNFKLGELENLFNEIQDIIGYFEQSQFNTRRYQLYLCNGDKINFSIPKDRIAHLLGINIDQLNATRLFKNKNSFELLKEIINDPYRINKLVNEGRLSYNNIFSRFISDKVEIFNDNIKPNIYETEFICKYDSKRSFSVSDKNHKYDYIIVKKYQNGDKYGILCLVKSEDENYYVPMSSQLFNSVEDLNTALVDLIQNQEITLINTIDVSNVDTFYQKKFTLPLDIKLRKLKKMESYKGQFNCFIDVTHDLEHSLSEAMKHMYNRFDDNEIINVIAESIKKGNLIDLDVYRNTKLVNIIEAFNDHLCSNNQGTNNSISNSYSKMKHELEKLKEELLSSKSQVESLTKENDELKSSNANLVEENRQHEITKQKIYELVKPGK